MNASETVTPAAQLVNRSGIKVKGPSNEEWERWLPFMESPKAVAVELGMTTAEFLAICRDDQDDRRWDFHLMRKDGMLMVWRPKKGSPK